MRRFQSFARDGTPTRLFYCWYLGFSRTCRKTILSVWCREGSSPTKFDGCPSYRAGENPHCCGCYVQLLAMVSQKQSSFHGANSSTTSTAVESLLQLNQVSRINRFIYLNNPIIKTIVILGKTQPHILNTSLDETGSGCWSMPSEWHNLHGTRWSSSYCQTS